MKYNNQILPLLFWGSIIITLFGVYITLFIVVYKNKLSKSVREKEDLRYQYETMLLNSKLEVQEEAFNKLSLELHDNVGQALGVLQYNLFFLGNKTNDGGDTLEKSQNILAKAINDLRNVSHLFNKDHINSVGLELAIQNEFDFLTSFHKLSPSLQITGNGPDLTDESELLIFRIFQEATANIIKHAGATSIDITINNDKNVFSLCITDNGKGFDVRLADNGGIGISNMHQRAKLLNGVLNITSQTNRGTSINLSINRNI